MSSTSRPLRRAWPLLCVLILACPSEPEPESVAEAEVGAPVETSAPADTAAPVDTAEVAADEWSAPDVPEPPALPEAFPLGLSPTALLGEAHGLRPARTIIHAHTIYSHDACDGEPVLKDGTPNEECLHSFRAALCTDHIDIIMLTEHYGLAAETADFEELFLHRQGDEWVMEDGVKVGNAVVCEDGHRALILPGLEGSPDKVSPLAMTGHPAEGDAAAVEAAYKDISPEGIANLRAHGAVPVAIHIESADHEWLKTADIDAVEVGNLHVLVAPDLRELVGLDPEVPIVAFTEWLFDPDNHPAPDLVFLEFHDRMESYHWWWDAILQERMVTGFAGNDVHQNVVPMPMADGDRPDSYRRMMKWYVNYLMVEAATPSQARDALRSGRLYMVFEVLGSPHGFDFRAEAGDQRWGMGDTVPAAAREQGLRLVAPAPAAAIGEATVPTEVAMRVYRVTSEGSEMVADIIGGVDLAIDKPGRYRVEVFVTPSHLAPYLAAKESLIRELPWVYTNPIEIE